MPARRSAPGRTRRDLRRRLIDHGRAVGGVRPLLAARGSTVPDWPGLRLRTLEDVFAYAGAENIELRLDGAETQARRPKDGRPGRRAFVSGKRKQNTVNTTRFSDGQGRLPYSAAERPGRMHDHAAVRTEGIAEQFRTRPGVKAKVDSGYQGPAKEFPDQVTKRASLSVVSGVFLAGRREGRNPAGEVTTHRGQVTTVTSTRAPHGCRPGAESTAVGGSAGGSTAAPGRRGLRRRCRPAARRCLACGTAGRICPGAELAALRAHRTDSRWARSTFIFTFITVAAVNRPARPTCARTCACEGARGAVNSGRLRPPWPGGLSRAGYRPCVRGFALLRAGRGGVLGR
ncbi:transposase family protein [Streptomyces sp. NRRL F-2664]|uniref:transposase family protein n=1 Tax=Streptomyces sp. NRRL F-2664 TaxID=1463842 RepID=UPI003B633570